MISASVMKGLNAVLTYLNERRGNKYLLVISQKAQKELKILISLKYNIAVCN